MLTIGCSLLFAFSSRTNQAQWWPSTESRAALENGPEGLMAGPLVASSSEGQGGCFLPGDHWSSERVRIVLQECALQLQAIFSLLYSMDENNTSGVLSSLS